jgi:hypothetical protein
MEAWRRSDRGPVPWLASGLASRATTLLKLQF